MNSKKKKRKKIKYKSVTLLLIIVFILLSTCFFIVNTRVKNIYIYGNDFLSDQQIIDDSGLRKYPKIISLNRKKIEKKLEENTYIEKVNIKYSNFMREVHIEIKENKPLLYYQYEDSYLLSDGSRVSERYVLPVLINQTPEDILKKLLDNLYKLDEDIMGRISEITYKPTDVDDNLFELMMSDGNLVYINFNNFDKLNNYADFIKSFNNKKGILHLDSGNYLEIFK